MKYSFTLMRYIARTYFMHLLFLLLGLMALIYFFDVVELIRRASAYDDVPLMLLLQMGLFKLPEVTQVLLSFTALWAALFTFRQLTQKSELIVVRGAGFSPKHFLTPVLLVAVAFGVFQIVAINPLGAFLISHYERLDMRYIQRKDHRISVLKNGLWLKESHGEAVINSDAHSNDDYMILRAGGLHNPGWQLADVSVFFFDENSRLQKRLDAPSGHLEEGQWVFSDVMVHEIYEDPYWLENYDLPTSLTANDIEERFSSAETVPFWSLPGHIKTLEDSGFQVTNLKVHFWSLLAQPLMMAGMIFIAAGVAMHLPRQGSGMIAIAAGLITGVVLFFFASFMQALGSSAQVPVLLAAFAPALLGLLIGLSLILHVEEH